MIQWWLCLIFCFVSGWFGYGLRAILCGDVETPRPPRIPGVREPEGDEHRWLDDGWLQRWERRNLQ